MAVNVNMRLLNIPPEIQQRFNIDSTLDVEARRILDGGTFTFVDKSGREQTVDATEFTGYQISFLDLPRGSRG